MCAHTHVSERDYTPKCQQCPLGRGTDVLYIALYSNLNNEHVEHVLLVVCFPNYLKITQKHLGHWVTCRSPAPTWKVRQKEEAEQPIKPVVQHTPGTGAYADLHLQTPGEKPASQHIPASGQLTGNSGGLTDTTP